LIAASITEKKKPFGIFITGDFFIQLEYTDSGVQCNLFFMPLSVSVGMSDFEVFRVLFLVKGALRSRYCLSPARASLAASAE
jgi:hypothetical protein